MLCSASGSKPARAFAPRLALVLACLPAFAGGATAESITLPDIANTN